eukprot:EG_transcript_18903
MSLPKGDCPAGVRPGGTDGGPDPAEGCSSGVTRGADDTPCVGWTSAGGRTLSAITFVASVGAFAAQPDPCTLGALLSTTLHGCCHIARVEDDLPYRVLNAMSLAACAWALYPATPGALPTACLAIAGGGCLSDAVRVAARDRRQGRGLFQLVVAVPAGIAMRYTYDGSLFSWHPVMAVLGAALLVGGVAVQRSGRRNWLHAATNAAASAATLSAVAAIVGSKVLKGRPHFRSFHTWCGLVTATSVVLQVAVAVPTVWPGYAPPERSLTGLHSTWGRITVALMALSIVTGFARVYGWPSPPTVLTTCLLGGTVLLLDTPLWMVSGVAELSL